MTDTQVTTDETTDVYHSGYAAGMVSAWGVTHVVHSIACGRFPWQVFLVDGRCVLLNARADDYAVIRSQFSHDDDAPLLVAAHDVPLDVLAGIRVALAHGSPS